MATADRIKHREDRWTDYSRKSGAVGEVGDNRMRNNQDDPHHVLLAQLAGGLGSTSRVVRSDRTAHHCRSVTSTWSLLAAPPLSGISVTVFRLYFTTESQRWERSASAFPAGNVTKAILTFRLWLNSNRGSRFLPKVLSKKTLGCSAKTKGTIL